MTTSFRTMSGQSFTLGSSISSTQTTILLTSFLVPVTGTAITMASMGTVIAYGTLAPGTSTAELISFTGVTQNANGTALLTGVTRGLDKQYPYTTSSSFKQPHAGQTIFILSDAPQVFNEYPAKRNDETITGQYTFPQGGGASSALVGATYVAPLQDTEIIPKKYADDLAIAGAPNATTTVKGIVELATQAEVDAKTATGGTGASLVSTPALVRSTLLSDYVPDTGTLNAIVITPSPAISAYTGGQRFTLKVANTNTLAVTVNVNGIGATLLKKKDGVTALVAGDIVAGQLIEIEYNSASTFFQLMTPSANTVSLTASAYPSGDGTLITNVPSGFLTSGAPGTTTTNTTATVLTYALAGGILSTNKGIKIRANLKVAQSNTSSQTGSFTIAYGGTTIASFSQISDATPRTQTTSFIAEILLMGSGATNTQQSNTLLSTDNAAGTGITFTNTVVATSAIDSTASQNITIASTSTNASVTTTLVGYFIQRIN